ncbi:HSP20 family molecular chaperone IbpA [Oikeobacillus pervagus]|uniref:HSP20 family molecular chaperone IbpA n=1 Tax=Oikeobacillus pervagus TaxID=1325931 RepID=A0AAJ1T2G8_9BACI|nr:Hsp20/alpha crystallin family protein [Oikeobacillus pervagus]MDQ0213650.1 HSP20 family molecular chaperone IbpA [Oikeobacillus pervagus]
MSDHQSDPKKGIQFGDLMKTMNYFFHERPVKGVLQSIDEFFSGAFPASNFGVDLRDQGEHYELMAKLPGIKKEQLHIEVHSTFVSILVQSEEVVEEENQHKQTFKHHSLYKQQSRTIPLPTIIDERKAQADYENGILKLTLPKVKGRTLYLE